MTEVGGVLDGGGGDDCIVTFNGGPTYISKGGPGNDKIIANLPANATDEQIDAICSGEPIPSLSPFRAGEQHSSSNAPAHWPPRTAVASIKVKAGEAAAEISAPATSLDITSLATVLAVILVGIYLALIRPWKQ